jgi:hypothetical protein
MQTLQPRTLSNHEFIRYCALWFDEDKTGLPPHWQMELLRRFTALAPEESFPPEETPQPKNRKQLNLFE